MPDPVTMIGAGGAIAGSLGSGGSPDAVNESTSGYASLPQNVKDFMQDGIFPRIQAESEKAYTGIPKRAIDESDTDPIFGSKRRVAYDQGIKDRLKDRMMYGDYTKTSTDEESKAANSASSVFIDGLNSSVTRSNPRGEAMGSGAFSGELAQILQGGNQGAINQVLSDYGFTDQNARTQNVSPQMRAALVNAARSQATNSTPTPVQSGSSLENMVLNASGAGDLFGDTPNPY